MKTTLKKSIYKSRFLIAALSFVVCQSITMAQSSWNTNGNAGSFSNFIGTTNNYPFLFRTNNIERMRIQPNGFVGIGVANPLQRLDIFGNLRVRGNIYVDQNVYQQGQFDADTVDAGILNAGDITAAKVSADSIRSHVYTMDENSKFIGESKFQNSVKIQENLLIGENANNETLEKFEVRGGNSKFEGDVNVIGHLKIPNINEYLNGYPQTSGSFRLLSVDENGEFRPTTVEVKYSSCPSNPVLAWKARPGEALMSFSDGTTLYGPNLNHPDDIIKCPLEGNVGIGTFTPNYKLDILGDVNASGYFINGVPFSTLWQNSGNGHIKYNGGNVGIGTDNPTEKLHVNGNVTIGNENNNNQNFKLDIFGKTAINTDGTNLFELASENYVGRIKSQKSIALFLDKDNTNTDDEFVVFTNGNSYSNATPLLTIKSNFHSKFNGTVHAKAVLVCSTGWCDYVFEPEYKLKSLYEVEDFILKNKHLPDVPSAKEIGQNEADVFELLKIQMKKIEELTLYNIQMQKQIDELKNK